MSSHDSCALNANTYTVPSPNTPVMANLRRVGKWSFHICISVSDLALRLEGTVRDFRDWEQDGQHIRDDV